MYTFFTKLLEFQWVLNVLLVADLSFFYFTTNLTLWLNLIQ